MKRARVHVVIAIVAALGVAVVGWLLARQQVAPPPGDVREVIAAYLADQDAAREQYSDKLITALGVVNWSARTDEVTTRAIGEWSPHLEELSKQATVLLIVGDHHQVLANFTAENQCEALALRAGEQATIRGRHYSLTSVVWNGKVILVLHGCEVVR